MRGGWPTSPARAQLLVLKCRPRKNLGCPRSRAFRDLGFHGHVNLGILFDGATEPPLFFPHNQAGWPILPLTQPRRGCPTSFARFLRRVGGRRLPQWDPPFTPREPQTKSAPSPIHSHRPRVAEKIEMITAPAPIFRCRHQTSLHRIPVHILQFLHRFFSVRTSKSETKPELSAA